LSYAPILLTRLGLDSISVIRDFLPVVDLVGAGEASLRAELFIASSLSNALSSDSGDGCMYR